MRAIRFQPDPLDHALLDFDPSDKAFVPTTVALIMNESYTGCSLVFTQGPAVKAGQTLRVQVGKLGVLAAEIVWGKEIAPSLTQIGIRFLD